MILHKLFHTNHSAEDTQRILFNLESYRDRLPGVEQADFTGHGISHWSFRMPFGAHLHAVMTETLENDGRSLVFKSLDGNLEAFGMISFHEIRPNLTEVEITFDYQLRSPVLRVLDRMFHFSDRFICQQLQHIRQYFSEIAAAGRIGSPQHYKAPKYHAVA
jgi:uncharacterized membrane protein